MADSEAAVQALLDELQRNDFDPDWERVDTPAAMRAALARPHWDIILAAYALEHFSASAALTSLRDSGLDLPLLVISDAAEAADMRAALSLGANDCIRLQNLARLTPAVEREVRAAKVRAARTLTEAALREAEAKYRQLVDQLPVGVHVMALDTEGSTLTVSPPLERILGFSVAEWVADPELWRRQIHPEDRDRALAELTRVFTPGAGPAIAEYRMLARDGHDVWIRDETILVRDAGGQPRYLQSVKLDISERRRLEAESQQISDEMARWVKELEQSHREVSLLDEMSRQLQVCDTAEAAYPIIADFVQLLFPAASGALYRLEAGEPDQLLRVAQWGRYAPEEAAFPAEACQALRRGRPVASEPSQAGPTCQHLGAGAGGALCVPLSTQDETLGLLHFRLRRDTAWLNPPEAPRGVLSEAKQRLAQTVAERAALALANLKRRGELEQRAADAGQSEAAPDVLVVGDLTLDSRVFELRVGERTVKPTPVEFELLRFLMRNAGQVYTAEQLLQQVWGYPPGTGSQELVRAHIKNLRAKMEPNPRQPIYLRTKGRFGYGIFAGEPAEPPPPAADA
ncbi:MAG: winged helix-turn-helix domain-containing protein [Anaerolineales bacterium]|nr:winged helix-turn-helix domain-containing protein [Anaerolineales bacterium]